MRKCILMLLAAITMVAFASPQALAAYKLRIGYHAQAFGSVDVVAWKLGYFDQTLGKGNYSLKQFTQGKLMAQAILSRSIDVAQAAARPYVGLIGKGSKSLVAIGVQSYWCGLNAIMVKPKSGLTSIKQLKGKKMVAGKATSTYYGFTRFVLPGYGLKESDYQAINSVTTERIPSLVAGTVDFASVQEPAASIAEAKGLAVRLKGLDWCKYDDPPFIIAADPRQVKAHPKVIENYLRAWLRAANLFKNDYNKFTEVFHQHLANRGRKSELKTIRDALKGLRMHPQIDDRFYNYVEKMAKVLKSDPKRRLKLIPNFRGGDGVITGPMQAALKAESWK